MFVMRWRSQVGTMTMMTGTLDLLSLVDLFQLLVPAGKSGKLKVHHPRGEARVFLDAGQIVHAEFDNLTGRSALAALFADGQGSYEFADGVAAPLVSIRDPIESLLLDMIELADTSRRDVRDTYLGDSVPAVTIAGDAATELVLKPDALAFLRHVNGRRSVNEVADRAELNPAEARQVISHLLHLGVLRVAERRPRTARLVAKVARRQLELGSAGVDPAILQSWKGALGYFPRQVACRTQSGWTGVFTVISMEGSGPFIHFSRDTLLRADLSADTAMLVKPLPHRPERN
jgi:predicted transcriptional regulator